jgi:hypothetical protein
MLRLVFETAAVRGSWRDLEAGHFLGVADEDFAIGNGGMIPGLAFDGLKPGQFLPAFWCWLDEGEFTFAAQND